LLLGELAADGSLHYVGKVGTGFDDAALATLTERLQPHERSDPPFSTLVPPIAINAGVTWVEPNFLAEVAFVDRTRAGMLRQARFHSLREDKMESRSNMQVSGVTLTNPDRVLYPEQGIT